jgi:uncharacterized membrane protein
MPGAGHRFYFVERVPLPFFVLLCLLFTNAFLVLFSEFAGKYFLPKTTFGVLRWYQDNSITIQFVLLGLMAIIVIIFRKRVRVRWHGSK